MPIPSNALFLEKSSSLLLSLHPQLKVATQELCYFAPGDCSSIHHISVTAAPSSFLQHLHLTLAAVRLHPWPPSHGTNTAHPYLWGSWGFSAVKNDTKIRYKPEQFPSWVCNAAPQALILVQHEEWCKSSWIWLRQWHCCPMEKSSPQDSCWEGWLQEFKPPPIHPTLLLQSLVQLLAQQLLNLLHDTALHVQKKTNSVPVSHNTAGCDAGSKVHSCSTSSQAISGVRCGIPLSHLSSS